MSKQDSMYKNLAKDTMLFAISSFGSKILLFLLTPLYTAILTTSEYGIADIMTTTVNFIYPVLSLAIAEATLRFALDKKTSKEEVLSCSLLFTLLSIVVLLCIYPLASKIGILDIKEYGIYFILIFAFFNINNCFSNFLKGLEKTKLFAITGILQTITIIICNIVFLLFFKLGVTGYLLSIVIGYAIPAVVAFFCGGIYRYLIPLKFSSHSIKEMLKYSIPMIPTLLAWSINVSIDKYIITAFCGIDENGLYSVAHKIPTLLTTVMSIFLQAWQISAISTYEKDNRDYTEIYRAISVLCLFVSMIVIVMAKIMAKILFTGSFYVAWRFVPLLTISAFYSTLSGFLASSFRAAKKTKSLFISVFLGAVINILLNLFLLRTFSTIGVAMATALSFGCVWIMRIVLVQKITPIRVNVIATICSQILLFFAAIIYTFEIKNSLIYVGLSFVLMLLINMRDLKKIILKTITTIGSYLKKGEKK